MQAFDYSVDGKAIKNLSRLTPGRMAWVIAFDWLVIALAIGASEYLDNWLATVAAIVVIGGRMHGMGVLIHDFAHYRFVSSKRVSEWAGDLLLAWPLGTTVDSYRRNHLTHHRHTNTDEDPDWVIKLGSQHFSFPQKWQYALANIIGYLLMVNSFRDMRSILARLNKECGTIPRSYRLKRLAFHATVLAAVALTGNWLGLLLYWVVPYFTVFLLFLHIRSVAEHFGSMDYDHELGSSRTVYPLLWERAFLAPHNVNYHLDHHLYPSVPFYNLPRLHALLLGNAQYARDAHITRGYSTGLVRECLSGQATSQAGTQPGNRALQPAE